MMATVNADSVIKEISPNDVMYKTSPQGYFPLGQQALDTIRDYVSFTHLRTVSKLLDMPCGHGRILRFLRAEYPNATIDACDLDHDAVDFCARTFGASPIYSDNDLPRVGLTGDYDLIWCGSLLTHVHPDRWRDLLRLFAVNLRPGGLMICTTHGRYHANRLRTKETKLGLTDWAVQAVLSDFDRFGFGYQNYAGQEGYGISLSSAAWVCSQALTVPTLRLVSYQERGWGGHQDVLACLRDS